jgi:sugar-specific transcriptional regulator TrmB
MTTLSELLKKIGFTDQEVRFVVTLLKSGSTTPSELAKLTSIHRATIYSVAKRLLSLGVIVEQKYKSGVRFQVAAPEKFEEMIKAEEQNLQERFSIAKDISKQIKELKSSKKHRLIPQYRLVAHADVEDFLYERALVWDESAQKKDGIWWGFQNQQFIDEHKKWLDWFWEHAYRKTRVHLFSDTRFDITTSKKKFTRREVKVLQDSLFTATTWVMGDYIVQITSPDDGHLIEIEHESLAENHRAVFRELWAKV